ncbi:DUF4041 domain-containing protein [Herbiconiux sp. P17]|uniref:DUF4041 domain-containing protein n=1 Tax=Herbiconiux wuyangfengii TaxID=3342794 RepID=UPI0035BA39E3
MTTPAGWYDDGNDRQRWWDGTAWTEHFADMSDQNSQPATPDTMPAVATTAVAPGYYPDASGHVRWWDGTNWFEDDRPQASATDRADKRTQKEEARAERQATRDVARVEKDIAALLRERAELEAQIVALRQNYINMQAAVSLQEFGIFDYEHPAQSSAILATELEALRTRIKQMVTSKSATLATNNFTFNNSAAQGRKFVGNMSTILLRAYNAEAENCVKTMRAGNLPTAQARLSKVAEQIARQGSMIQLSINPEYHRLRLYELELAARHLQVLQAEKEAERERREEIREQKKAEQELRAEKERLAKERQQYLNAIAALEANGDTEGVERMRASLADVDRAIEDVDYRAANIRAGHVYVISNRGAFGPQMVKIGMTRRLVPEERVTELGDASVPFRFDIHALFFAHDAVSVEAMLHQTFADRRVNRVNLRREFFYVTPEEVLGVLRQKNVTEVVSYSVDAPAEEFTLSRTGVPAASASR